MANERLKGKTLKVTGFLEEFEKDVVKDKVDIVSLFREFGVALSPRGKSFTGLCPFHEDKNPSLSVDREKGLYHCFGCGAGGDVFDAVEKLKGLSFKDALAWLKEYAAGEKAQLKTLKRPPVELKADAPPEGAPAAGMISPPEPEKGAERKPEDHAGLSLKTVAEYYHTHFAGKAADYLVSRGFTLQNTNTLAARFMLGFADGSLLQKISNGQRKPLKECGILTDRGTEHFAGCLTVPLPDEAGIPVGLYGRKVDDRSKVKHLYLKGPHKGLFNIKAFKVYDEIILTESLIDSLSLLAAGLQNVSALYGVNGFTEQHLGALKDNRVKTVVLALDSDEAGREAALKLEEKLLSCGLKVKKIFPDAKDWNEDLKAGLVKEAVLSKIERAPLLLPVKKSPDFSVRRENGRLYFTFETITYRILAAVRGFTAGLRVNVRAQKDDLRHIDNLDLYSARSRAGFSREAARLFQAESARIENDLLAILEYLEEEREKAGTEKGGERVLTGEEEKLGLSLLQDPEIFSRITEDLSLLGYVGEEMNKQLVYLAASSRKLEDPVSVLILSQSAAGKSLLVETVRRLMPPEDTVAVSSLSDQALNYYPEGGLVHKFLILGEAVHTETVEHQIREMLSSHELSRLVAVKDEKTGRMSTQEVKSEVIVSAVMSSTRTDINPENASRCFVINSDESEEQTRRIHALQSRKYSLERVLEKREKVPLVIRMHHAAQRMLKKRTIVNPYAALLDFPGCAMRTRRDHERFLDLIACVCHLRQYQKEEKERPAPDGSVIRFIECDIEDYRIAFGLIRAILPASLSGFPKGGVLLYEALRCIAREKAAKEKLSPEQVSLSQREIREKTQLGQMFVKRYLRLLVEWEYVKSTGGARGGRQAYSLIRDEELSGFGLSSLTSPEELSRKVGQPGQSGSA